MITSIPVTKPLILKESVYFSWQIGKSAINHGGVEPKEANEVQHDDAPPTVVEPDDVQHDVAQPVQLDGDQLPSQPSRVPVTRRAVNKIKRTMRRRSMTVNVLKKSTQKYRKSTRVLGAKIVNMSKDLDETNNRKNFFY